MTQQQNNWILKQYDIDELHNTEMTQQLEKIVALLKEHKKQNEETFEFLSTNGLSKQDLKGIEKKNTLKINLVLGIVAIEAIMISVQFFF